VNDKIQNLEDAFNSEQKGDDKYFEKRMKELELELEEANVKLRELQRREVFI